MDKITVNAARCKGCYLCVKVCSKQALLVDTHVNEKGYLPVRVDTSACVACGACYRICPDYVFTINH